MERWKGKNIKLVGSKERCELFASCAELEYGHSRLHSISKSGRVLPLEPPSLLTIMPRRQYAGTSSAAESEPPDTSQIVESLEELARSGPLPKLAV